MTNIVQLVGDGGRGGGTTYILELTRRLLQYGYNLTVITNAGSFLETHAHKVGASAIGLPFNARRNTANLALLLRRHLNNIAPAIVHAHGSRAGLPTALTGLSRPWKFIYTVHGLNFALKPQPARSIGWIAERVCMRRADEVVFVSKYDRELAKAWGLLAGVRHPVVIQNAAEVKIKSEPAANRIHDIGFLGRLVPVKNPLILCDVLIAMRPLRPTLLVIGGGPLESEFRSRAAQLGLTSQIVMTGELPRTQALQALAKCRILVLTSNHEGQPLAVMEAAHLGIPAVASAVTGMAEIIKDGETGYLVPSKDVASYADRLGRLLIDAKLTERMSLAARSRAAVDFCFERVVDQNLRIYGLPVTIGPASAKLIESSAKAMG